MKNQGFKKPGVRQWLDGHPSLSPAERERVLQDNEQMVARLKSRNLPMDRDFGSFDAIEQAIAAVPQGYRDKGLFIIRCPHRTEKIIQRKLFVPWAEVVQFVQDLPGGYQKYKLGIREVTTPLWSGTIISSCNGRHVVIELWKGKHLNMDDGGVDTSFRGTYRDEPGCPRRFLWSDGCTDEAKWMMLGAFRYFAPRLRTDFSFYTEFSLTADGYRFHGLSFDPFWTEIGKAHSQRPIDGD